MHPLEDFDGLPENEKKNIEQVLFLLETFSVGYSFYHELSMICNSLFIGRLSVARGLARAESC